MGDHRVAGPRLAMTQISRLFVLSVMSVLVAVSLGCTSSATVNDAVDDAVQRSRTPPTRPGAAADPGAEETIAIPVPAAFHSFGGWKQSGLGRDGSRHGLSAFTEIKYVCLGDLAA